MNAKKQMLILLLGGLLLAGPGCRSWMAPQQEPAVVIKAKPFDFDGIPEQKYLVGGGYRLFYRAPVAGELYLADADSRRLLATVSLQAGEMHEMEYDVQDENLAANLTALGIDPKKAEFKLYFVPR